MKHWVCGMALAGLMGFTAAAMAESDVAAPASADKTTAPAAVKKESPVVKTLELQKVEMTGTLTKEEKTLKGKDGVEKKKSKLFLVDGAKKVPLACEPADPKMTALIDKKVKVTGEGMVKGDDKTVMMIKKITTIDEVK